MAEHLPERDGGAAAVPSSDKVHFLKSILNSFEPGERQQRNRLCKLKDFGNSVFYILLCENTFYKNKYILICLMIKLLQDTPDPVFMEIARGCDPKCCQSQGESGSLTKFHVSLDQV